jgi:carboxymethylenebutenolidase
VVTIGGVSCGPVTISDSTSADWVSVANGPLSLRCWWSRPTHWRHDINKISTSNRAYIVLPEVFGVNAWVRSVADRLAAQGIPALAIPLFARTAPDLELAYKPSDLAQGRAHKDATTASQILSDVSAAVAWLQQRCPNAAIDLAGFCFGGHAALLAATLPQIRHSFDFYGAGVSRMRPGGGAPSLELLPQVAGQLTCVCGSADPLIPEQDRTTIRSALAEADPSGERLRYIEIDAVDHGFMCEARDSFDADASALGWQLMLA